VRLPWQIVFTYTSFHDAAFFSQAAASDDPDAPQELRLPVGRRPQPLQSSLVDDDAGSGTIFRLGSNYSVLKEEDENEGDDPEDRFPSSYVRYKRYREAVALSMADTEKGASLGASALTEGPAGQPQVDATALVAAMKEELDVSRRLVPIVALRLFLERVGLSVSPKAHPEAAAQVRH
jgi:hypothetical protein